MHSITIQSRFAPFNSLSLSLVRDLLPFEFSTTKQSLSPLKNYDYMNLCVIVSEMVYHSPSRCETSATVCHTASDVTTPTYSSLNRYKNTTNHLNYTTNDKILNVQPNFVVNGGWSRWHVGVARQCRLLIGNHHAAATRCCCCCCC
jgi:hypothetical protein